MTREVSGSSSRTGESYFRNIENAFERRSKSIKHRTKSFSVTREKSAVSEEFDQNLVVVARLLIARSTHVRMHVWSDGAMWLGIHQGSKSGWLINIQITGYLTRIRPSEIVRAYESSLDLVVRLQLKQSRFRKAAMYPKAAARLNLVQLTVTHP